MFTPVTQMVAIVHVEHVSIDLGMVRISERFWFV